MTARFLKMLAKLSQFQNFHKVEADTTPTSQVEMEQNIRLYSKVDEIETLIPPANWGFTFADVIAKDAEIKTEAMLQLREQRDKLLIETDKITMMCYSRGISVPTDWATYQQELRDIPSFSSPDLTNDGSLTNVVWPVKPLTKP